MHSTLKLSALAALLQVASAQMNCSDYSFTNNFANKTAWQQDFERTSLRSLGNITAPDSGDGSQGTQLYITTSEPGSVTLRSYAWFSYPATFEWDITGSDIDGTMTALTVWSGFSGGTPEIDLELQGWSERRNTVMHPIWAPGHGDEPIGLSNAPEGWPSSDTGPIAEYQNGWTAEANDRYVANQTGFSNTDRHTYKLEWLENSLTWSIDGTEFVTFTKGENSTNWPQAPLPIAVGVWASDPETQAGWMGEYNYDESNPPMITVYSVSASGCSPNTTEEIEAARDSAFSLMLSPLVGLAALFTAGLWILA